MKNNKGVTLIVLSITIIVLLIIAAISIYNGVEMIQRAKLEELRTNMLLIEAKVREYVEEVNFKMGPLNDEAKKEEAINSVYVEKAKMQKGSESGIVISTDIGVNLDECYVLTNESLEVMALNKIEVEEGEAYIIKFDEVNVTAEIYNTDGFKSKDGKIYYSLTDLENIEE